MEQEMMSRKFIKGGVIRLRQREPSTPDTIKYRRPKHVGKCKHILTEGPEAGFECDKSANDKKDRCYDHIEDREYVAKVLREIQEYKDQLDAVLRNGIRAASLTDNAAKDIFQFIDFRKAISLPRLKKDSSIPAAVCQVYCRLLEKAGKIVIEENSRRVLIYKAVM